MRSLRAALTATTVGVLSVGLVASGAGLTATTANAAESAPSMSVAHATRALASTTGSNASITDDELDGLADVLAALPADLKNADPATTPDYEQRLSAALSTAMAEQHAAGTTTSGIGVNGRLGINWIACAASLASAIIQYAVPVTKVVKWIKEARALGGGITGIWKAIHSGIAARQIGGEAAKVLEGILGVRGVVEHCF